MSHEELGRWPTTLVLAVDEVQVAYAPTPGDSITVPMSGESTTQFEEEHRVHTRVVWEDGRFLAQAALSYVQRRSEGALPGLLTDRSEPGSSDRAKSSRQARAGDGVES